MSNIVIFGAPHSGKTTLLGYLSTAMLRHPQFNVEVLQRLKLIRNLGMEDDFHIGDPYNPVSIRKDIILPSFVSLDRDELRKFADPKEKVIGGSKRLHHKQLTLCMSERRESWDEQNENENISCTFIDLPGFRQRISDKYKGFFEGDIGLAMLDIAEVLKLEIALGNKFQDSMIKRFIEKQEKKLFEPVRIWCDYRSPAQLVIVLSKIDQKLDYGENGINNKRNAVERAITCIRNYTEKYGRKVVIPIVPISIRLIQEKNTKSKSRMKFFFRREEENIYAKLPNENSMIGEETLIACLRRLLKPFAEGKEGAFSMASVDKPMRAIVNNKKKTALQIRTIHGNLHNTETVFLGPVLDKRYNEVSYVRCNIASLKSDGAQMPCTVLLEGNVGGTIFKGISNIEGRTSNQYALSSVQSDSDIRILRSTIMFKGKFLQGDIVALEISEKDYMNINGDLDVFYENVLRSIEPNDEMILFWYGKKILVNVVEIRFVNEKLCLSLVLSNSQHNVVSHFALPCDADKEILHSDNVLLAIPESNYLVKVRSGETIYTYISACIKGIRDSSEYDDIWIEGNQNMELADILKGSLHFGIEKLRERDVLQIPIKSNQKKYSINATLASINKNLKNNFNRAQYRKAGGVEIYLVKNHGEFEQCF